MLYIIKSKLCLALCLSPLFTIVTPNLAAGDCLTNVWPVVYDSTAPAHESIYTWYETRGECEYGVDWDPTNAAFMQYPVKDIFANAGPGPYTFRFTIKTGPLAQSDTGMVRVFELVAAPQESAPGPGITADNSYPLGMPAFAVNVGWETEPGTNEIVYLIRGIYYSRGSRSTRLTNQEYLEPDIVQVEPDHHQNLNIEILWLPSTNAYTNNGFLHLYVNDVLLAGKYELNLPLGGPRAANAVRYGALLSYDRDGTGTLHFARTQPSPFRPHLLD